MAIKFDDALDHAFIVKNGGAHNMNSIVHMTAAAFKWPKLTEFEKMIELSMNYCKKLPRTNQIILCEICDQVQNKFRQYHDCNTVKYIRYMSILTRHIWKQRRFHNYNITFMVQHILNLVFDVTLWDENPLLSYQKHLVDLPKEDCVILKRMILVRLPQLCINYSVSPKYTHFHDTVCEMFSKI